jgi:hypothetical protein
MIGTVDASRAAIEQAASRLRAWFGIAADGSRRRHDPGA